MKITIGVVAILISLSANAQAFLPGSFINNSYRGNVLGDIKNNDTTAKKKWFVSKYASLSTSYSFFNSGSAMVISAPVGLQLNRKLNNNLFAFAGVSVAPAYVDFRSSFMNGNLKNGSFNAYQSKGLDLFSKAELGLQYVNDARTFYISGSIGVERSTYPLRFHDNVNSNYTLPRTSNF